MADKTSLSGEKNPHTETILEDVTNRTKWAAIDEEIIKRRLGQRKKKKTKPYDGAPNSLVPIVDDITREKTDQEITMTCNAPIFAHVIPLQKDMAEKDRATAEMAFDAFLRYTVGIRPKLEEAMDTKNVRGFGLFKIFRSEDARFGLMPDCDSIDPRDLIVPYFTKDLKDAIRITHVLRLNEKEMKDREDQKGWKNVDAVIQKALKDGDESDKSNEKNQLQAVASIVGLTTSGEKSKICVVWEHWHYATDEDVEWDKLKEVKKGEKCCTVFSPDADNLILSIYPWREEDIDNVQGKERPWPFIQARYENRSRYYYETRGIGHICMDDQICATAEQNAKLTLMDYYQQPLLTGVGAKASTNVNFEPGSVLPEGLDFVAPPTIPNQFDFDVEMFRRTAARRGGAASQYEFSREMGSTGKIQKTATEVKEESLRSNILSSASVDRFNDPCQELYQQLWDDLARMKKELPLIINKAFKGTADPATIYKFPVMIIPSTSAKMLNPDTQFNQSTAAFNFLMTYKEIVPINVKDALMDIISHWDPVLASRWLGDDNDEKPAPIYQVMENMQQQIEALAKAAEGINNQSEEDSKILERVARMAKANAEKIEATKATNKERPQ